MTDSIERALGRLDGKVDLILVAQHDTKTALLGLETRTSSLERWQAKLIGAAAVVGFIVGVVLKAVT